MPVWGQSEEHTKMSLRLGTVHVNRKDNHFEVPKQEVTRHIWRADRSYGDLNTTNKEENDTGRIRKEESRLYGVCRLGKNF